MFFSLWNIIVLLIECLLKGGLDLLDELKEDWLRQTIKQGENSRVDFKRAIFLGDKDRRRENQELAQDLTAFANSYGGFLVIGVSDEKEGQQIVGFNSNDQMIQRIVNICRDWVQPPLRPQFQVIYTPQGEVLVIYVEEGKADLSLVDGRVFIRVYNEVRQAVSEEITEIILRRHLAKAKELFHQSLSSPSNEQVELADLLINVIQFNQHLIRTKDLLLVLEDIPEEEIEIEKIKSGEGQPVEALIQRSDHLLAKLNLADINYLQDYLQELKELSSSLKMINPKMEELVGKYYYAPNLD